MYKESILIPSKMVDKTFGNDVRENSGDIPEKTGLLEKAKEKTQGLAKALALSVAISGAVDVQAGGGPTLVVPAGIDMAKLTEMAVEKSVDEDQGEAWFITLYLKDKGYSASGNIPDDVLDEAFLKVDDWAIKVSRIRKAEADREIREILGMPMNVTQR